MQNKRYAKVTTKDYW